ncbi:MAG: DNA primase DnaG, partial [Thermoplasmata archaeon]
GNILDTIQLNELFEKLSTTDIKGSTLITGGIISQRLVDIAYEKGIDEIYGMKILNVTKKPADMKIVVRNI